jgi:hypothetical protein
MPESLGEFTGDFTVQPVSSFAGGPGERVPTQAQQQKPPVGLERQC